MPGSDVKLSGPLGLSYLSGEREGCDRGAWLKVAQNAMGRRRAAYSARRKHQREGGMLHAQHVESNTDKHDKSSDADLPISYEAAANDDIQRWKRPKSENKQQHSHKGRSENMADLFRRGLVVPGFRLKHYFLCRGSMKFWFPFQGYCGATVRATNHGAHLRKG